MFHLGNVFNRKCEQDILTTLKFALPSFISIMINIIKKQFVQELLVSVKLN